MTINKIIVEDNIENDEENKYDKELVNEKIDLLDKLYAALSFYKNDRDARNKISDIGDQFYIIVDTIISFLVAQSLEGGLDRGTLMEVLNDKYVGLEYEKDEEEVDGECQECENCKCKNN